MPLTITQLFPLGAMIFSALAWWQPQWFVPAKAAILPLLAFIMFCMGLSLTLEDFKRVLLMPQLIVAGTLMQFLFMPLLAWLISQWLALDPYLLVGMVLVGACPGGTASNVICYLAKANVALSISLTAVSTVLAVVLTPLLSWLYANSSVDVPTWAMLKNIMWLVFIPVTAGLLINQFLHRKVKQVQGVLPVLSVVAIIFIIAIVVGLNQQRFADISSVLVLAVVLHNLCGLVMGYSASRLLGYTERDCRTLAIEVGMQNSGLAVALALKNFSSMAALPGTIFSIWHNLSGSMLAAIWQKSSGKKAVESV